METDIRQIVRRQNEFFASGATLPVKGRLCRLKKLYASIRAHLDEIHEGLRLDLGKSASESYMCETGLVLAELSYMIKHVRKFAAPRRVRTPLSQFPSRSYILPSPYGTALVIAPWNYPFLLALDPLIGAVAAGNTVLLKISASAPHTGKAIELVLSEVFEEAYVATVCGGACVNEQLWECRYDYIFFTGSKETGKFVCRKAAETLTPVTLELGGKSPCIVTASAPIPLAARRIVWGKYLNLGQTCVAPDYIFCDARVHDRLLEEIQKQIRAQFGDRPLENPAYGKMINEAQFRRVLSLVDAEKTVCGGQSDEDALRIAPTVTDGVTGDDAVMGEEIFGPVLPIMTYTSLAQVETYIRAHDAPLALYVFSRDNAEIRRLTENLSFGGGCVNDTVVHLATSYMPFGGVGASGSGAYHGKASFDTFTHYKSILRKSVKLDLPMRYAPYGKRKDKWIRKFLH